MSRVKSNSRRAFSTALIKNADDPSVYADNYSIVRLVKYGFSTHAISDHVGLTHAQVQTRVRMYGLQGVRRRFRHGMTEEAEIVREAALQVPANIERQEAAKYNRMRDTVLKRLREAYTRENY